MVDSVAEEIQSMKSLHARRTIPHGRHGLRRCTGALVEWGRLATALARAVPDFLVIGAMRGGTSFLYHYLTQHPMVLPAFRKEVRYFDRSYRQRKHPFLWYRSFFPLRASLRALGRRRKHRCVTGEATPSYLFLETVPPRVLFTVPHVRLIAMLRNPVDRALSHYFLECRRHRELLPPKEALLAEEERVDLLLRNGGRDTEQSRLETMQFSYQSFGVYVDQIKRWRMWFPASQMLILQTRRAIKKEIEKVRQKAVKEVEQMLSDMCVLRATAKEELGAQRKFTDAARICSLSFSFQDKAGEDSMSEEKAIGM